MVVKEYVNMGNGKDHVKNVAVVEYVSMVNIEADVLSVAEAKYVNIRKTGQIV